MRGPLPAPEGRDRGSDAEQHGTSRAGGASAEGAASRRVASDFGAVGAGTRLHGQTPAGGRRRRQESHGCLCRVRAELATPCPRCPSLHAGGAGLAVGLRRDRPAPWVGTSLLTPAVRTGSAPPIDSPPGCAAKPRADPLRPRVWPPDPTPSVSHKWFLRRRVQSAPVRVAATRPPAGARPNALTL